MTSPATTGRKELVILLGAGASVEAGIPASFGMSERIRGFVGRGDFETDRRAIAAFDFIYGTVLGEAVARGAVLSEGVDVERLFAAVELLSERYTIEAAPFVQSWHPEVTRLDRDPAPYDFAAKLDAALRERRGTWRQRHLSLADLFGGPDRDNDDAKKLIQQLIDSTAGDGSGRVYRKLADDMVRALVDALEIGPGAAQYLTPALELGKRPGGLTIATLNYDTTVEQTCEELGISWDTQIESWNATRRWDWDAHGVRLLKLHGSIDWRWEDEVSSKAASMLASRVLRVHPYENFAPAIVFGSRSKLRADGPFLSLLAALEVLLHATRELVVVGYSFRDAHVNEVIRSWIITDEGRSMTVVDPGWTPARLAPFARELDENLGSRGGRHQGERGRFRVIAESASNAVKRLF